MATTSDVTYAGAVIVLCEARRARHYTLVSTNQITTLLSHVTPVSSRHALVHIYHHYVSYITATARLRLPTNAESNQRLLRYNSQGEQLLITGISYHSYPQLLFLLSKRD